MTGLLVIGDGVIRASAQNPMPNIVLSSNILNQYYTNNSGRPRFVMISLSCTTLLNTEQAEAGLMVGATIPTANQHSITGIASGIAGNIHVILIGVVNPGYVYAAATYITGGGTVTKISWLEVDL